MEMAFVFLYCKIFEIIDISRPSILTYFLKALDIIGLNFNDRLKYQSEIIDAWPEVASKIPF